MIINLLLVIGTLAVIGSWVVAVRILQSDKFSDTAAAHTVTDSNRRTEVLASTTL